MTLSATTSKKAWHYIFATTIYKLFIHIGTLQNVQKSILLKKQIFNPVLMEAYKHFNGWVHNDICTSLRIRKCCRLRKVKKLLKSCSWLWRWLVYITRNSSSRKWLSLSDRAISKFQPQLATNNNICRREKIYFIRVCFIHILLICDVLPWTFFWWHFVPK